MFSAFQTFGKLGALASSVARAWSPLALWPDGISSAGMWISPRDLTSQWKDYTGTTPVATPGTVADTSNPVGLALDIRAGATVLTDPGNHMLQSTSAARPLLSARVNLLRYTEDLTNAAWSKDGGASATSTSLTFSSDALSRVYQAVTFSGNVTVTLICAVSDVGKQFYFACWSGILDGLTTGKSDLKTVPADGVVSHTYSAGSGGIVIGVIGAGSVVTLNNPKIQLEYGSTASDYQPILTNGSSYSSTGFPIAQLYDGVDDGMATAAFAAGTLINGMDCMIAVRRDSAAATYLISDTGSRGFFEWESGNSSRPDVSAGTPTYFVDGVAVTATKGALFTALTAGDWHILEARGLDLSTWTAVEVSKLVSYLLNGARGDILLYPSTTPTEDKDAARQWLADYYGVTLP